MSFAPFKTISLPVFSRKGVAGIPDSVPRSWNPRNIFSSLYSSPFYLRVSVVKISSLIAPEN
jgi:hypothetical protein